jgi:hypothetical protein
MVKGLAYRLLGSDSDLDDLMQESFAQAHVVRRAYDWTVTLYGFQEAIACRSTRAAVSHALPATARTGTRHAASAGAMRRALCTDSWMIVKIRPSVEFSSAPLCRIRRLAPPSSPLERVQISLTYERYSCGR